MSKADMDVVDDADEKCCWRGEARGISTGCSGGRIHAFDLADVIRKCTKPNLAAQLPRVSQDHNIRQIKCKHGRLVIRAFCCLVSAAF